MKLFFRQSIVLICDTLFLLCVCSSIGFAQPYDWEKTLSFTTECVSFNPLSRGKTLYCASLADTGIFRSDDGGLTWKQYNNGLQPFATSRIMQILCVESDTNVLLAVSTSSGLFRSTNGGVNWSTVMESAGILGEAITWHRKTDALYYGQNFMGPVWKSIDHGATWVESAQADTVVTLCTIAIEQSDRKRILAGSGDGGIALSDEEGMNWRIVYPEEDPEEVLRPEIPKIVWSEASPNVVLATRWLSKDNALVRSLDAGETWSTIEPALPRTWALEIDQRRDRANILGPTRFWVGLFNRGLEPNQVNSIIETHDAGKTWLSTGLPKVEQVWMIKYDSTSDRLVAATSSGLYVTTAKSFVKNHDAASDIYFSNNPASSVTKMMLPNDATLKSVRLLDVAGRTTYLGADELLDVSSLPNGVYVAEIVTNNATYRTSLVVAR
jgi:photosystem II stability/assembly factor-like uncharacterized protein